MYKNSKGRPSKHYLKLVSNDLNDEPWRNNAVEYEKLVGELCYRIFYESEEGAFLLYVWQEKYLKNLNIAEPEISEAQTYYKSGFCEFLRSITAKAKKFINNRQRKDLEVVSIQRN
jgi:hypothetical protein